MALLLNNFEKDVFWTQSVDEHIGLDDRERMLPLNVKWFLAKNPCKHRQELRLSFFWPWCWRPMNNYNRDLACQYLYSLE